MGKLSFSRPNISCPGLIWEELEIMNGDIAHKAKILSMEVMRLNKVRIANSVYSECYS